MPSAGICGFGGSAEMPAADDVRGGERHDMGEGGDLVPGGDGGAAAEALKGDGK